MSDNTDSVIVEAGHGEYAGSADGVEVEVLWAPYGGDEGPLDEGEVDAQARFVEKTGLTPDSPQFPRYADFTWQQVWRLTGTRTAITAWFDSLLEQVSVAPSGDDDTFDYWPSGVRLAQQVAAFVGGDSPALLESAVRDIAASLDGLVDLEEFGYATPPQERAQRLRTLLEEFDIDPADDASTSDEDAARYFSGDDDAKPIRRYAAVTVAGDTYFVYADFDTAADAQKGACAHAPAFAYSEMPYAVVDLDTGERSTPQWHTLQWSQPF